MTGTLGIVWILLRESRQTPNRRCLRAIRAYWTMELADWWHTVTERLFWKGKVYKNIARSCAYTCTCTILLHVSICKQHRAFLGFCIRVCVSPQMLALSSGPFPAIQNYMIFEDTSVQHLEMDLGMRLHIWLRVCVYMYVYERGGHLREREWYKNREWNEDWNYGTWSIGMRHIPVGLPHMPWWDVCSVAVSKWRYHSSGWGHRNSWEDDSWMKKNINHILGEVLVTRQLGKGCQIKLYYVELVRGQKVH